MPANLLGAERFSAHDAAAALKSKGIVEAAMANPPPDKTPEANAEEPRRAKREQPAPERKEEPTAEAEPKEKLEAEPETGASKEAETETVELADTIEGLAEQLGVPVEQLIDHLQAQVKVNGQESRVKLRDLVAGYQMEADYRQKTAKLSETERLRAERERQLDMERQHYANVLVPMINTLAQEIVGDEAALEQLLLSDPHEYQVRKHQLEKRKAALQGAQQQLQIIEQRRQQETAERYKQSVLENERKLYELFPHWQKDIVKARDEMRGLREYAKSYGIDPQLADTFIEAPFFQILHKAKLYDGIKQAKAEVTKKVQLAPPVTKPGAAQKKDGQAQRLTVAKQRLRKTHHWKDAGAALKELGILK